MKVAIPLFVAVALAVSACATTDGLVPLSAARCPSDADEQTAGVDWEKADIIDIKIENEQFSPLTISLNKGQAYVLKISNKEKTLIGFEAIKFFSSVSLAGVTISGKDFGKSCFSIVQIEPQGNAELRFVASRKGEYLFANNTMVINITVPLTGAFGYIYIN